MANMDIRSFSNIRNLSVDDNQTSDVMLNVTVNATELAALQADERSTFEFIVYAVAAPILFGVITLLGIVGNCLVIYVILTRQRLQTVTNILLFNLALADLSFVVICPPFTAYQLAMNSWPFSGVIGEIFCKLMHYLLNVTVYVTIYTLVLISVVRYMTVVRNSQTLQFRNNKNIIRLCVAIWSVMLVVNAHLLVFYKVLQHDGEPQCDSEGMQFGRVHFTLFFAYAYVLPFLAIAVFSLLILQKLHQNKAAVFKKSTDRNRHVSYMLIFVIVIFAVLWLPIHIHLIVAYWGTLPDNNFYKALTLAFYSFAYFNSCVNPIIYNYTSKEFRESFREVACCVTRRATEENEQEQLALDRTEMTMANGHQQLQQQQQQQRLEQLEQQEQQQQLLLSKNERDDVAETDDVIVENHANNNGNHC